MEAEVSKEEMNEVVNEVSNQRKPISKMEKAVDRLLLKINGKIKAERETLRSKLSSNYESLQNNIDKFVSDTNDNLGSFKKRYEAMYTDLVRRILVKLEHRVFSMELFTQATLDTLAERIYNVEVQTNPEIKDMSFDDYKVLLSGIHAKHMQTHHDNFAKRIKEEGEANVAVQEEKEVSDAGGEESQNGDQVNPENSGTSDQEVSQQA